MLRKRPQRRVIGALLLVGGAVLMWLAPESRAGASLLVGGLVLEAIGLRLEHRDAAAKEESRALE